MTTQPSAGAADKAQPPRPHWAARHPRWVEGAAPRIVSPSPFTLVSDYRPAGDQPQAIGELLRGLEEGERNQVLLGVTGSGKTYTMALVIEAPGRPALVRAPNKTLAAQLYGEM